MQGPKKSRRSFSPELKKTILLQLLKERRPVADIAEQYDLAPTQIYAWQNEAFSRLDLLFDDNRAERTARDAEKERLKEQLKAKENFATELLEEYTKLKKRNGLVFYGAGWSRKPATK